MSTRSVIAVSKKDGGFKGRYHHWDGDPENLGKTLFEIYREHFKRDLKAMLKYLLKDHTSWSTINGADFNLPAGFRDMEERYELDSNGQRNYSKPIPHGPECYCHGNRNEKSRWISNKNAQKWGCEYAYVFDAKVGIMTVFSSYNPDGAKMIGYFGKGNPKAQWHKIGLVNLNDDKDPEWEKMGISDDEIKAVDKQRQDIAG